MSDNRFGQKRMASGLPSELGRRRGRDEEEQEENSAEVSVPGSGFSRAAPETLAQRRMLRLNPQARAAAGGNSAAAVSGMGGGVFAGIKADTTPAVDAGAGTGKPFVWGSGFYTPPEPTDSAAIDTKLLHGQNSGDPNDPDELDDKGRRVKVSAAANAAANLKSPAGSTAQQGDSNKQPTATATTAPFGGFSGFGASAQQGSSSAAASVNPFGSTTAAGSAGSNFTFSFAPPPSSISSTTTKSAGGDNNNDANSQKMTTAGGGAAALAAAPVVAPASSTSLEGDAVFQSDACKLFLLHKDEDGKTSWKERGTGVLKALGPKKKTTGGDEKSNDNAGQTEHGHLLMRNTQTKKVILYCPIDESMKIGQVQDVQVVFSSFAANDILGGPPPKDAAQSFLLRALKTAPQGVIGEFVSTVKKLCPQL